MSCAAFRESSKGQACEVESTRRRRPWNSKRRPPSSDKRRVTAHEMAELRIDDCARKRAGRSFPGAHLDDTVRRGPAFDAAQRRVAAESPMGGGTKVSKALGSNPAGRSMCTIVIEITSRSVLGDNSPRILTSRCPVTKHWIIAEIRTHASLNALIRGISKAQWTIRSMAVALRRIARFPLVANGEHQNNVLPLLIAIERHIATLAIGDQ